MREETEIEELGERKQKLKNWADKSDDDDTQLNNSGQNWKRKKVKTRCGNMLLKSNKK